jgi:hypothetical protein
VGFEPAAIWLQGRGHRHESAGSLRFRHPVVTACARRGPAVPGSLRTQRGPAGSGRVPSGRGPFGAPVLRDQGPKRPGTARPITTSGKRPPAPRSVRAGPLPRERANRAGHDRRGVVRGCPQGTGYNCRQWHASSTASETTAVHTGSVRHHVGGKVRPSSVTRYRAGEPRRGAGGVPGPHPNECHASPGQLVVTPARTARLGYYYLAAAAGDAPRRAPRHPAGSHHLFTSKSS